MNSEKAVTHYERGRYLLKSRRFEEAASAFVESLRAQPDFLASAVGLGLCRYEQRDGRGMFEAFARALALMGADTADPEKWLALSKLYFELGYPEDSAEAHYRALGLHRRCA